MEYVLIAVVLSAAVFFIVKRNKNSETTVTGMGSGGAPAKTPQINIK